VTNPSIEKSHIALKESTEKRDNEGKWYCQQKKEGQLQDTCGLRVATIPPP
jgi:hypothetical protein